ncbi:hypothetical protein [Haloactinospora alba]|uniref:hypothetical protein n=1 Tax=Haloactinospora alba TaxID=405555 RepID=UPI001B87DF20|nr:hypothetical protein [Haloactinospora alba]
MLRPCTAPRRSCSGTADRWKKSGSTTKSRTWPSWPPDVAVVHARQHPVDDQGRPTATDTARKESIVVFVLVRDAQGWRIRVGQNTAVA